MKIPRRPSLIHGVLAVSVILFAAGIWWGLPSYRGWAPDELFPSRVLDGMRHLFSHGWSDIYPPFHYYILGILYAPFYLLHKLHWINLEMLSWYTLLFYIARLVSVVMSTATVYLVYKCGREIFDDRSSLFAALISVFAVPYVYYAKLANLDSPYIFWFILSLFYYLRILKTHRAKYYYLFTVAAVLAVCTKDQAYGLYILAPIVILFSDWQYKREGGQKISVFKAILERRYFFLILLGAGLFVLLHNIIFNARGFLAHFKFIVGPASKGYQIYPSTLAGQAELLGQTIAHIRFSFGWPLLLACAAGLLLASSRPKKNRLLLSLLVFVVSYYVFYTAVILYNYDRFNMPINIVLSLFAGYALSTAWESARRFSMARAAVVGLLFAYSLLYAASIDVLMIADGRYSVERWMRANIPKDALIGVASPIEYCPRLDGYLWSNLALFLPAFKQKSPRPEYVLFMTALSRRFADDTPEHRFFSAFTERKIKYRRVLKHQTNLRWLPLRTGGAVTNLSTINPEIQIYQDIAPSETSGQ